jgi:4-amino-4-deoxy-L-arabinose transferase-like glycosyltransferase
MDNRMAEAADSRISVMPHDALVAVALVGSVMVLALALRLLHLDLISLWSDELFSRYYVDLFGLRFVWGSGLRLEPTPPLYYMILDGWIAVFGDSPAALRSLSVVASVAVIPIVYQLAREFGSRRQALLSILLLALSPMAIYFAQEARVYAMLMIPVSIVLLSVARFLREPRTRSNLIWYALAGVVGVYCHPTFPIFLVSCNIVVIWFLLRSGTPDLGRCLAGWIAANAVIALAGLPEAIAMTGGASAGVLSYIPPLQFRNIVSSLSALVTGLATNARFPGGLLALALLSVLGVALWLRPPGRRELAVTILVPSVYFLVVILISLKQPMLLPRILCWMTIPLSLVIARALFLPSRARIPVAVVSGLVLVVGLTWQIAFSDTTKEAWRDALGTVSSDLARADLVVVAPASDPLVLTYYTPTVTHLRMWDDGVQSYLENTIIPDRLGIARLTTDALLHEIRTGHPIWLIANGEYERSLPALLEQAPAPTYRADRFCGNHACVAVLAWGTDPAERARTQPEAIGKIRGSD